MRSILWAYNVPDSSQRRHIAAAIYALCPLQRQTQADVSKADLSSARRNPALLPAYPGVHRIAVPSCLIAAIRTPQPGRNLSSFVPWQIRMRGCFRQETAPLPACAPPSPAFLYTDAPHFHAGRQESWSDYSALGPAATTSALMWVYFLKFSTKLFASSLALAS